MDVPADLLEKLKCSKCATYLSRGPIYLQHDGAAACSRCYTPKNPATRNIMYEDMAQLVRFPCKNRDLGCSKTVPFAEENEEITHEASCMYRQYVCPVLSAHCEWLGIRGELLQHCKEKHPDYVFVNPCRFSPDISKPSLQNYLITAFKLLFLLHTKVCLTTGKIFLAVRFLGASEIVSDFSYTLDIKRGEDKVSKKGQVLGQGCLAIQEDTSLVLAINSLLDHLGGGDGIIFDLTLKRLESLLKICVNCGALVSALQYRNNDGWFCKNCAPSKRTCSHRKEGCDHKDYDDKCVKHEINFCQMRSNCDICGLSIAKGTLFAHYDSAHRDVTFLVGSTWRIIPTCWWQKTIVQSIVGIMICWYKVVNQKLIFEVHSLITNKQLQEFKCTVRITQPSTEQAITLMPEASSNTDYDWRMEISKEEFTIWSDHDQYDISVDIKLVEEEIM